ncbi:amino acid adenylation domain-containing protein [Micromonospora sp. NPDC092111]|uniref:non-ribosomal peptide synthetase n=1 Tax=Micromonospora sp. NPDC092111 TaxID=3364289 RepID=UPI00380CDAFC
MDQRTTLHALFEHHARIDPDRSAVVAAGVTVSYGELNRRANRIARRLRELGVGPGTMVGISVDRSADLPAALLAILKAGGAYVPLDPGYPADRLTLMIEDTAAPVIVCGRRTAPLLPRHDAALVLLDQPGEFDDYPADDLDEPVAADDPAYVIYTSGSTGRPKGVLVTHDGVVNLVTDQSYVSVTATDRVAALATLAFDASTFELWAPLVNGATCVVYEFGGDDLAGLVAKAQRDAITVLHLTSPIFRLLEPRHFERLAGVHTILFGGDSVRIDIGVRARESFGGRLIHLYGPTETTGFATFLDLAEMTGSTPYVPIGGPIRNVHVRVVDEQGRPVPDGATGELVIGGRGVARGYLNRPDITAERFVPDPDADPGADRYRTGDLARITPEGTIQFLGRLDRQIKVRGYRIEPGEIESVLTGHPDVRDAVVVAREDGTGDKRLDAYLVPARPDDLADRRELVAAVRAHVREALPSYQRPATLTVIETIPLTDNLKVDQDRLPAPAVERAVPGPQIPAEPGSELETMLAALWCDTLGLDGMDLDDNFFDLGGDSLSAVHVAAAVEKATGRPVTVRTVFQHPTIRALSQAVTAA